VEEVRRTIMLEVQLEPEMEARLEKLASATNVSKHFLRRRPSSAFIEDREDYLAGIRSLAESKYTITLDEMERRSRVAEHSLGG
jgi:predicted transcriptional regulator